MRLALVYELELEVAGAQGDGGGFALGDETDTQAAETGKRDAEAVVGGEALEFEAVLTAIEAGLGKEVELSVGEDTLDVEEQDLNAAGAVFRGYGHD
jgi:hypothetical protein